MNNSTLFVYQATNFQFLSVCNYITSFGLFFYNLDLIPLEHRNHSSAVLNTYFEYIQKWKNPNEAKLQLLKRVLKDSDLYGGGEYETLDMKYVNETYQYIISNVLFSHYGNIHGYLAEIINQADNITYLALKEKVYQHFSKNYTSRDYCSSRNEHIQLTSLTVHKVFIENLWSMFPPTEKNLEILDVDYIYAMIGFKIIGSFQADRKNLTLDSYILLARSFEFQMLDDEEYQLVLELFATPALFYYVYYEKEKFRNGTLSLMMKTDTFWHDAYEKFFQFNNFALERIVQKELRKSLYYKLNLQVEKLESRTILAYKFLKLFCDSPKLGEISLSLYKFSRWLMNIFLPDECKDVELPDLEEYFTMQFDPVRETYNEIEQNSLEKVLTDGNLIQKMNSNTTVEFARVPSYPMYCMYCAPWPRKMNQDIYLLFAIVENNRKEFYAIRQVNNTLSLLTCSENEQEFARAVAGDPSLKMDTAIISKYLKQRGEDYKSFIQRVADIKTDQFIKGLMSYYRDPTDAENILDFLKSLVPFYTCIENIKSGNQGVAAFTCSLDIFSLVPIASVAGKYSSIMLSSFISEIGRQSLRGISKSIFVSRVMLRTGLYEIYNAVSKTVSTQIFTMNLVKDLSIATLRTLDPGFELVFQFGKFSYRLLEKIIQTLSSSVKTIPKIKNLLMSIKNIFNGNINLLADHNGLIPRVLSEENNFKIVRYIYPGGSNYFGPKCVSSFGRTAELRTIDDSIFQVPVVPMKSPGDLLSYREYNPKTGEILPDKLKMGGDDILHKLKYFIYSASTEGKFVNEFRNDYQVYYNTVHWRKRMKTNAENDNHGDNNGQEEVPDSPSEVVDPGSQLEPEVLGNSKIEKTNPASNRKTTDVEKKINPNQAEENFDDISGTLKQNSPGEIKDLKPKIVDPGHKSENTVPDASKIVDPGHKSEITVPDASKIVDPGHKSEITVPDASKIEIVNSVLENTLQVATSIKKANKRLSPIAELTDLDHVGKKIKLEFPEENFDDIPGTSKQSAIKKEEDLKSSIVKEIDRIIHQDYIEAIMNLKKRGLSLIRMDHKEDLFLRSLLSNLAFKQIKAIVNWPLKSFELYCVQKVNRPKVIEYLKNMKGSSFFFNDITLLTNKPPPSVASIGSSLSTEVEVHYNLKINSQYGFIDLSQLDPQFTGEYITYNDVFFKVMNTYFTNRNNILVIELMTQDLSMENWWINRNQELISLMKNKNLLSSSRMEAIDKAANFMTDNIPLCTHASSVENLKKYILKMKASTTAVPTYDQFAKDYHNNMKILPFYESWRVENWKYIDDVLFERNLDTIGSLNEAAERIYAVYDLIHQQSISEVFESYTQRRGYLQERIRFEDYYIFYAKSNNKFPMNRNNRNRYAAAIYRTMLRQSSEEWINTPIKIYSGKLVSKSFNMPYKMKDHLTFEKIKHVSTNRERELENIFQDGRPLRANKAVLIEIDIKNQAGIMDYGRILESQNTIHLISPDMIFVIDGISVTTINQREVVIIKLHDLDVPTEKRMINIARKLDNLYSTNTDFFFPE